MVTKNCRWVLADSTYCEAKVAYTMEPDGGEVGAPRVRKYKTFCETHQARVDARNKQ